MPRGLMLAALLFPAVATAASPKPPRLALVVVVDGLGQEALHRARRLSPRGAFERLASEGAAFHEAHLSSLATHTSTGHAVIATGAFGHRTGIVSNRFWDRVRKVSVPAFSDPGHPVLEARPDAADQTSPLHLVGETLADRVRLTANFAGKAVAVSLKDRGAVALAGRLGTAWWFSEQTGRMTTSTYYAKELPDWVRAFNAKHSAEAAFGKVWERLLPEKEYPGPDDALCETAGAGLGRVFPHPIRGDGERPGPSFFDAFAYSPFAVELELLFAKAAIDAEALGKDDATDLLGVSFTSLDIVSHGYGPESQEALDILVRIDRAIAELVAYAERAAGGRQNLVVALAADHGFAPTPERLASLGYPAGRVKRSIVRESMEKELASRFGGSDWVEAVELPDVYLNADLLAQKQLDPGQVQEAAGRAAARVPGVGAFFTRAQIARGELPPTPEARAAMLSFHSERSGDLVLTTLPFFVWGDQPVGSSHGSGHRYDTHVPLVFWGAGVKPGQHRATVDLADLAPTLAALLSVEAPALSEGAVRSEVFR